MQRILLRSKIHRVRVTGANVDYEGSIAIDADLLDLADIAPFEKVEIYDITNGNRIQTYAIVGARGSGTICVNGAAARLVHPNDLIIICCYGLYDEADATGFDDEQVLRALGVRTSVAALLDEPGGAAELLDRLADPDRAVTSAQLHALYGALADLDPEQVTLPDELRAVVDGRVEVVDAADAVVVDSPDLLPFTAGVPLLPTTIWGSQRIWTKGHGRRFVGKRVPLLVTVGEPMRVGRRDDNEAAAAELRRRMQAQLEQQQLDYPEPPPPPGSPDAWWVPARLGGTAPTLEEAAALDAAARERASSTPDSPEA